MRLWIAMTLLGLAAFIPSVAIAQTGPNVSGTGISSIERPPEILRLSIEVGVQGKDSKDALDKLKIVTDAAQQKLAAMGVTDGSIKIDDPHIDLTHQQIALMQRMNARGNANKAPAAAATVDVAATISAEWPLKGSAAEIFASSADIMAKVREADLAGKAALAKAMTPEEQEAAEETAQQYSGGPGQTPGEPQFTFVSKITPEERDKALADAFKLAREDATRLAKAAGADIGPVQTLETTGSINSQPDYAQMYRAQYYGGESPDQSQAANSHKPLEAVGVQPNKVEYVVSVTATFGLK